MRESLIMETVWSVVDADGNVLSWSASEDRAKDILFDIEQYICEGRESYKNVKLPLHLTDKLGWNDDTDWLYLEELNKSLRL